MLGKKRSSASPVVYERLLEPVVRKVRVIGDDDLKLAIKLLTDLMQERKLTADGIPIGVLDLLPVGNLLREERLARLIKHEKARYGPGLSDKQPMKR